MTPFGSGLTIEGVVEGEGMGACVCPEPELRPVASLRGAGPDGLADPATSQDGPVVDQGVGALLNAMRPFGFLNRPDAFNSQDGGCTEALIDDADVQRVRFILKSQRVVSLTPGEGEG